MFQRGTHVHDNHFSDALESTLAEVARVSASLRDPWWIIGSAALVLLGIDATDPVDVDLLTSTRDAEQLLKSWASRTAKEEGRDRFRSLLGIYCRTPIPIEVMGGLELKTDGVWQRVEPASRVPVMTPRGVVFVPDAAEQRRLLRLFGRPKDLARLRDAASRGR